jgi:hypothetical protein
MEKSNLRFVNLWLWAVSALLILFSSLPLILVFPLGDVFSSSLRISPDGFDWIIEGRALLSGVSDPWPVLRNTNLVLLSALDSLIGQTGVIFAAVNSVGLLMQGVALLMVLRVSKQTNKVSFFVVLGYYLLPLHFLSLYVLADTIAVGTLMLSAAFFIKYWQIPKLGVLVAGFFVSITSGLFQTYGLAPLLVFSSLYLLRALGSPAPRRNHLEVSILVFGSLAIFGMVRNIWTNLIPHQMVPTQAELIKFSFDMAGFYFNLWPFLLSPVLIAVLSALSSKANRNARMERRLLSEATVQYSFALGFGLMIIVFFYQWPESRFSYTYVGVIIMLVIVGLSTKLDTMPTRVGGGLRSPIMVLSASMILIFSLYAPANPWQPKLGEFSVFGIWTNGIFQEFQPHYLWYAELRGELCAGELPRNSNDLTAAILDRAAIVDPYTRAIGSFGLSNCL